MASYKYTPVMVLQYYVQEWEDYGESGFGDVDGQPLRSGEYLSFDVDGCRLLIGDLRRWFDTWAVDVMQQLHSKSLQDRMFVSFLWWLVEYSESISCTEELIDVFDVEELRGGVVQCNEFPEFGGSVRSDEPIQPAGYYPADVVDDPWDE